MSSRRNKAGSQKSALKAEVPSGDKVKFPKPKILLLGLEQNVAERLAADGYNISVGTLGKPYRVAKGDGFQPVIGRAELPNHTEQEIVVVDLLVEELNEGPDGEKHTPDGDLDVWAKCNHGFIDPRPRAALQVRSAFDRIYSAGGIFVVFANAKSGIDLIAARCRQGYGGGLYDQQPFPTTEWGFLTELSYLSVREDHGEEMEGCDRSTALGRLVAQHLVAGCFTCSSPAFASWIPLVKNKFGDVVGAFRMDRGSGILIVLPQLADKETFLSELFGSILPALRPALFPSIIQGLWTRSPDYELSRVIEIKAKQAAIEQRARELIDELNGELDTERADNGWLHDLLTGTDAVLVNAVKKALAVLGFSKVVDIDTERDREGKSRREDLQICDQSPTLVVDVKGIGGIPKDEDALQADKHAAIRMREQKRTDIVGLSIINHQRHLPPLDRENAMPFRQELLDAAEEHMLGLMTSWDLYRLVVNFRKLGWRCEDVVPLLYGKGRIQAVPRHYQYLGIIAKAWTDKFGVVIEEGELRNGERIAVEFPIQFEETAIDSIYVNDHGVEVANIGDPAGLMWSTARPKLREGMRVFRIDRSQ